MTKLCVDCSNPISERRLQAVPNATLCITCKSKQDDPIMSEPATNLSQLGFTSGSSDTPGRHWKLRLGTFGLQGAI